MFEKKRTVKKIFDNVRQPNKVFNIVRYVKK